MNKRNDLPYMVDRIKALFIDLIILIILAMIFSYVLDYMAYEGASGRIYFLFFILLYEPIMVSLGGTIGHRALKMRVRSVENEDKNINFFKACLRVILKSILGWISLLTMNSDKLKRAIHDQAAGSFVLFIDQD